MHSSADTSGNVIIRNASVLQGPEFELRKKMNILIAGGIIADIGENETAAYRRRYDGLITIDGKGMLAIPGFVNAHVHLNDAPLKDAGAGMTLEELVHPVTGLKRTGLSRLGREERREAMRSAVAEMIRSGITDAIDFHEEDYGIIGEISSDNPQSSILTVLGRPQRYFTEQEVEGNVPLNARELSEFAERIAPFDGTGLSGVNEYSDSSMKQIRQLSGKRISAIHAAESMASQSKSIKMTGKTEVFRAVRSFRPDFVVHMTNATDDDIMLVKDAGCSAVLCPRSNSILGVGVPPVEKMMQAGINIALGTDNIMLNSPDMFREMDFISRICNVRAGRAGVLKDIDALRMATLNGAKLARRKGAAESGSIVVGFAGDIVMLDMTTERMLGTKNPVSSVVHRAGIDEVVCTIKSGRVVFAGSRTGTLEVR